MLTRILCTIVLITAFSANALQAQQWSAEQKEVWEFEKACWQKFIDKDMAAIRSCFHEDYRGWYSANPVPMPLPSEAAWTREMEKSRMVAHNMTPHHIMVYGNVAIVHLTASITEETEPDQPDKTTWYHWTDISLKEDGKWSWIADHGHPGNQGN